MLLSGGIGDILGDPAWTALATLLAAVSIGVPIWLYRRSRSRKALSFGRKVTQLVDIHDEARGKISIRYEDRPVEQVYLVEIHLKNSGNVPILQTDFDQPLTLDLGEATPMTVDLGETVPEGLAPELEIEGNRVKLRPLLLNPGDELTFKVLVRDYGGVAKLTYRIVGISDLTDARAQAQRAQGWRREVVENPFLSLILVGVAVAVATLGLVNTLTSDSHSPEVKRHARFHSQGARDETFTICGDLEKIEEAISTSGLPRKGYTVISKGELARVVVDSC